jgi:hypothetical protein
MGNKLDAILKKHMIDSPTIVTTTFSTESIDIDNREADFAVQLSYDNGTSVDMTLILEASVDGTTFIQVPDSDQAIIDATGSHIWDVSGLGPSHLRVTINVTSGSITVNDILYTARRRH